MILIANVGNRDVQKNGSLLNRNNLRQASLEILNNFNKEEASLSYPILEPYFREFGKELNHVYLFATNQEDTRYNNSDTLHVAGILKKIIEKNHPHVRVNVVEYPNNPTDHERIFRFFTDYFTQKNSILNQEDTKIISLSGGTPQMNGALYIILSLLYPKNIEFYNVDRGTLNPVNHELTIRKVFLKNTCLELLKGYNYSSLIALLSEDNLEGSKPLLSLLRHARARD
ncbi:MAG: hypothetical protein ACTSUK_01695, partial [Promethearchaeota archaeon]